MNGRAETTGRGVLAIDGPAGAGKSTVARAVADQLGLTVLDTGAMYRAVTLACLRKGVPIADAAECAAVAARIEIDQRGARTLLDGDDVTDAIRTPEVNRNVSAVSAHAAVRRIMVDHQRAWADRHGGGVVEGRDIGTVVFPDARVKIFLVASGAERARRRLQDEEAAGRAIDVDALRAELARRDAFDSQRTESPLTAAPDAVRIDSTGRTVDDVVAEIVARYEAAA